MHEDIYTYKIIIVFIIVLFKGDTWYYYLPSNEADADKGLSMQDCRLLSSLY